MPYDPSTLIPAYKEKVEELLANDEQFRNIVEKQVSDFPSMATSSTNGITLKEGIAGVVAGKPRRYDLNESPYFKKNKEKYKVLSIMHKAVTRLPISVMIQSSKKSAKKPTSPEISYTEAEREKGDKKLKTILAKMPAGLNLEQGREYTRNAYIEAYPPSKKSVKKSVKKSAKKSVKKPTSLNMKFLPGPSELPGAMQRIPSSTFGLNKKSAKKSTTLNMNFLPGESPLPHFMKKIPSSTGLKPNPYGKLRKKRKATKKNKPSKRSKASKKSKSSKKTRRRTRRRRY